MSDPIETVVRSVLTADSAVAAIIGPRAYFMQRPQNESAPALVFQTVSDVPGQTMCKATWAAARIQVNCWAPTYPVAKQLAAAVRDACNTANGTGYHIEVANSRDLALPTRPGREFPSAGVAIDLLVSYLF